MSAAKTDLARHDTQTACRFVPIDTFRSFTNVCLALHSLTLEWVLGVYTVYVRRTPDCVQMIVFRLSMNYAFT